MCSCAFYPIIWPLYLCFFAVRRWPDMASQSLWTCVVLSGTASSLCWRSSRSLSLLVSTLPSSSSLTTSGRSRGPTSAAPSLNLRLVTRYILELLLIGYKTLIILTALAWFYLYMTQYSIIDTFWAYRFMIILLFFTRDGGFLSAYDIRMLLTLCCKLLEFYLV